MALRQKHARLKTLRVRGENQRTGEGWQKVEAVLEESQIRTG